MSADHTFLLPPARGEDTEVSWEFAPPRSSCCEVTEDRDREEEETDYIESGDTDFLLPSLGSADAYNVSVPDAEVRQFHWDFGAGAYIEDAPVTDSGHSLEIKARVRFSVTIPEERPWGPHDGDGIRIYYLISTRTATKVPATAPTDFEGAFVTRYPTFTVPDEDTDSGASVVISIAPGFTGTAYSGWITVTAAALGKKRLSFDIGRDPRFIEYTNVCIGD